MEIEERFWSKVAWSKDETVCWPWKATLSKPNGYGRFWFVDRLVTAHCFAYALEIGDPGDQEVDHRCRNKLCCNPLHLRPVTHKQNSENHSGPQRNNTSGVRGVSWDKEHRRWRATVMHNGRWIFVGRFIDLADAETAVIAARNLLHTHNDPDRIMPVREAAS